MSRWNYFELGTLPQAIDMSDALENLSNVEDQDEEFPEVKEDDIKVCQISVRCNEHDTNTFLGVQSVFDIQLKI